ncbi:MULTISPECIES: ABC transporter ATP-binding protein [Francisella]|uniref:ABC transporter ATP-binding protein n=3 Tax=Francisella TaxID=262 RepID=A0AAJ4NN44_9GAMM|nr:MULTISPECIES: ABC transporter ATP-binding protein [Francisella]AEI35802.1 ABC transporter related protein [Francisella salina]QEO57410.1 ABC transporter ATP-binding protein [Francisella marina]QEO58473.1 ABC transporter ATP-binding protein [Francisella marina]QWU98904.1 ABC transporter ATP-binding protein [Francisella salimarina]
MDKNIIIKLEKISKYYKIYERARDRVKEAFSPFRKKYYKEFCAIKDIDLEIKRGEVLGIFGLNGAGKSTLLKIIAGVVTPTAGSVKVQGHVNAMLELTGSLNPELTGEQNIKFNLNFNNIANEKRAQITQEIVEFAEIGRHINQPVKNYSNGMKARLGFGIATATKPEVLIVDEVLAVGDAIFQNKCFIKIRELLKEGTTVVFVSHNVPLMVEFCTRAIFLHDRQILMDDEPRKVAHYYQKALFSSDKNKVIEELYILSGKKSDYEGRVKVKESSGTVNDIAYITNLKINDARGVETSFLEMGFEYTISFDVTFNRNCEKVKIEFVARDITGKFLTLFNSYSSKNIIESIEKNETYHVENTFKCDVYKGQYSIEVDVIEITDDRLAESVDSFKAEIKFEAGSISKENKLYIKKI